ncbi:MAG: glycosyltransferase family 4 protein [Lutibacter sp.]
MHICFLTSEYPKKNFPHGGVGTFIASISKALVNENIKVSIVGVNYENCHEETIEGGIAIYRLKPVKIKGLTWFLNFNAINNKILEIHKETPIDIVESAELGLAFINKIKGIKYVIRMHGGHHFFAKAENRPTEWKKVWQEKRSFKKADYIAAVSNFVANETNTLLNLNNKLITVIYNPIDTRRFYQADSKKMQPYTIFFAGTIIEKKGIRQLVQAMEYLVDDFPEIKLKIAGRDGTIPGSNIPYRPILENEISERIRPHIEFLGIIPNFEIPEYIEKSHLCCYPSHMEAMPLAWLEVMAMGKIFIGSKTGPGPETIQDNQTGFLVNPLDPKDIANKIKYIFDHHDEAIQIGHNARQVILDNFDLKVLIKENLKFYNSIL